MTGKDEKWLPTDMSGVEWFAEKVFEHEMEIRAIEARRRALVKNLDDMAAEHRRAIDTLMHVYGSAVQRVVRQEVQGKKVKHVKTPYGRLGFRKAPSTIVLEVPEEDAVKWAEAVAPEIVKKRVNKTDLKAVGCPYVREVEGEEVFYVQVAETGGDE
jgi:hypothetical protein